MRRLRNIGPNGKSWPQHTCWCGNPECCRGERRPDRTSGYQFELTALFGLGVLFTVFLLTGIVEPGELAAVWFMPSIGIIAATIAMSTPAGGGVVFFPTMVLLGVPPLEAVAFSLGAQSVGMGIFGTFNWLRKDRSAILVSPIIITVLVGWIATLVSLFAFPIEEAKPLALLFSFFGLALALHIFNSLRHGMDRDTRQFKLGPRVLTSLVVVGLIGGTLVGYVGVGIDALIFLTLTSFFKIDSHEATVTSILTMGITAMAPFAVHLFILSDVPMDLWLMVLPGILLGARIGPWLNYRLGRRRILIGFSSLLVIEFMMTFTKLMILS